MIIKKCSKVKVSFFELSLQKVNLRFKNVGSKKKNIFVRKGILTIESIGVQSHTMDKNKRNRHIQRIMSNTTEQSYQSLTIKETTTARMAVRRFVPTTLLAIVFVIICQLNTVSGQTVAPTPPAFAGVAPPVSPTSDGSAPAPAPKPNFGYLPCQVCDSGEVMTSAASIIPAGTFSFLPNAMTCIELEIIGLNSQLSPPQCAIIHTSTVPSEICGCKSVVPVAVPSATDAPVVATTPSAAPVSFTSPTAAPLASPLFTPVVIPTATPIGVTAAPVAVTATPVAVTTAPVAVTEAPSTTLGLPTTAPIVGVVPTAAPIAVGVPTQAPAVVPPSTLEKGSIRIRLFFVQAKMVDTTVQNYESVLSQFFTENLNANSPTPTYTNVTATLVRQELITNSTRRSRIRRMAQSSNHPDDAMVRLLQSTTNPTYPLDTYVDVLTLSSNGGSSNGTTDGAGTNTSAIFTQLLISTVDANADKLITALKNTGGTLDPIYFADIVAVNTTSTEYTGPITPPVIDSPTAAPTAESKGGSGLSNGIIAVIVIIAVNVAAIVGYQVYLRVGKKHTVVPDTTPTNDIWTSGTAGAGAAEGSTVDAVATPKKSFTSSDANRDSLTNAQSAGEDTTDKDAYTVFAKKKKDPLSTSIIEPDIAVTGASDTGAGAGVGAAAVGGAAVGAGAVVAVKAATTESTHGRSESLTDGVEKEPSVNAFSVEPDAFSLSEQQPFMGDGAVDDKDGNSYAYSLEAGTDDGLNTAAGMETKTTITSLGDKDDDTADGKIPPLSAVSLNAIMAGSAAGAAAATAAGGEEKDADDSKEIDKLFANPKNMVSRVVVAPAGKLGIVIDTTIEGPVVHKVFTNSPLEGKIFVGDIIVAIDGVDTRAMSAASISDLMVRTANKPRKLSVLSADDIGISSPTKG